MTRPISPTLLIPYPKHYPINHSFMNSAIKVAIATIFLVGTYYTLNLFGFVCDVSFSKVCVFAVAANTLGTFSFHFRDLLFPPQSACLHNIQKLKHIVISNRQKRSSSLSDIDEADVETDSDKDN